MLINILVFLVVIFLLLKRKVDRSNQKIINDNNTKYLYKYRLYLSLLNKNKNDKTA